MSRSKDRHVKQTNLVDPGFLGSIRLNLDRTRRTLREQLQEQLRSAIQEGRLTGGQVLPATRVLARDLGIARSVVVDAYQQLIGDGYLSARTGSATRVLPIPRCEVAKDPLRITSLPPYSFGAVPDPALFPRREWLRHYRSVLASMPDEQLNYPEPTGTPQLRRALAGYLCRVRGVVATPERIVICAGVTQGIVLVCRALRARGIDTIAVEDPGFAFHRQAIARTGLHVLPIPVDNQGLQVAKLPQIRGAAVLTTPAHSYPTGTVLSAERRAALLTWAQRCGGVIIEDDYDAEFRYDRSPLSALQGLSPERVVFVGSASKTLTPALRLGWLMLPTWLLDDVTEHKLLDDMGSPTIEQLAMAQFIDSGALTRHLRRVRPIYRRRRETTIEAMTAALPGATPQGVAAGLHLYVQLPDWCDVEGLTQAAAHHGVFVEPAAGHRTAHLNAPGALILGYGALADAAIRVGLERLDPLYAAQRLAGSSNG